MRESQRGRAAGVGRSSHGSSAEPMLADAIEQRLLDRRLVGRGSGPLERRIAPRRRLRVGVNEPVAGSNSPSCRFDPVGEQVQHLLLSIAAADRMRAPDA